MLEAVPWLLCASAVLAVLYMILADHCRRRKASEGPRVRQARRRTADTRRAVRKATRENLDRIEQALGSDRREEELARLADDARDRQ